MTNRRNFLKSATRSVIALQGSLMSAKLAGASLADWQPSGLPEGTLQSSLLHAMPGKQALIKRSFRPPNYETPLAYFDQAFTSNDRFFVRYHHAGIPDVDSGAWALEIQGDGLDRTVKYTLAELRRKFEIVEIPALCMCAGNRRGLFAPHVPGIQWGSGAMGNAKWRGVRLRDVLNASGIRQDTIEVSFNGADTGVLAQSPDFIKSLPLWKALDEHTLIAFEMNGATLPHWHGHPARLIVPGWAATYWVKHLTHINALTKPFDGFWMKTAYRIPKGMFPTSDRFVTQETELNVPITELLVNSLISNLIDGQHVEPRQPLEIKGFAWDGGQGIKRVEVSVDDGRQWQEATLGQDDGKYAWRSWHHRIKTLKPGPLNVLARATNRRDASQPSDYLPNPSGYHHNAMAKVTVHVI